MIEFQLQHRINTHKKKGAEYALRATDSKTKTAYVLFVWDKKPTDEEVSKITLYLIHAMNFSQQITPRNTPDLDYGIEETIVEETDRF